MKENRRRKLNDLLAQRSVNVDAAAAAYDAGKQEDYASAMEKVTNLNTEIEALQTLIREEDRQPVPAQNPAEARDAMNERVGALRKGDAVTYDVNMVRAALRGRRINDAVTLASGSLVEPSGAGTNIRGGDDALSSIIDQVSAIDATGMGAFYEPYVLTELTANGQKIADAAGKLRTDSDPGFAMAKINPYEVNVTTYVDRNLSKLTPAAYDAKIFNMIMRALRRKVISLIYNGDGQATPDFFGIKTAKNTDGANIYGTVNVTAVDVNLLDALVFSYGGDEELGGNAGLYLTKTDLKAIGALRGLNEKKRLYNIAPLAGNANCGTITDGGLIVPYALGSALTSLSASVQGAAAIQTMLYGDPANFELALFGGFTVRLDESYKAGERLNTLLGDVTVGGNLVADKGFLVATMPKA